MKPLKTHEIASSEVSSAEAAWRPEILEGSTGEADLPADLDLAEVWYWFHSRLRALGELGHDGARLTALLTWNGEVVGDALRAARVEVNQLQEEDKTRQVHLEFLTAEYLARLVLEQQSIPSTELHPA